MKDIGCPPGGPECFVLSNMKDPYALPGSFVFVSFKRLGAHSRPEAYKKIERVPGTVNYGVAFFVDGHVMVMSRREIAGV